MPKLITPLNQSEDGWHHSANGNVTRVFEQNQLGQLVEIPFAHKFPERIGEVIDKTVFRPDNKTVGQIYAQTKLGK